MLAERWAVVWAWHYRCRFRLTSMLIDGQLAAQYWISQVHLKKESFCSDSNSSPALILQQMIYVRAMFSSTLSALHNSTTWKKQAIHLDNKVLCVICGFCRMEKLLDHPSCALLLLRRERWWFSGWEKSSDEEKVQIREMILNVVKVLYFSKWGCFRKIIGVFSDPSHSLEL